MRTPSRWVWAVAVAVAVVASGLMAQSTALGFDYLSPPCEPDICDDAALPINALLAGDASSFFGQQAPMGVFSILLRAPLAALGESELTRYRLGAFVCLLAAALLAVYLAHAMAAQGRSWMAWTIIPAALLVNPLTYQAMDYGHPEEVLAAALCVAAVLASARRRVVLAGVLIGCAIATKQWAVLAVLPVLIATPAGRLRLTAVSAAVVVAFTAPMMIGNFDRFFVAQQAVGFSVNLEHTVTAANVWWPLSDESIGVVNTPQGPQRTVQYSLPQVAAVASRLIVATVALGLALLYARRRREAAPEDVLSLIALIFLLRGIFDPLTYSYHHLPFLLALVTWEGLRRRLPVASTTSIAAILALQFIVVPMGSAARVNAFYLAWSLPLAAYLTAVTFAPDRVERLVAKGPALLGGRSYAAPTRAS